MKAKMILSALVAIMSSLPGVTPYEDNTRVKRSKGKLPGGVPEINRDFTRSSSKRCKGSRKSGGRK